MLDNGIAFDLVVKCIRAAGGSKKKSITVADKLEDLRLIDQERVDGLRRRIVHSKKIGLASLKPQPFAMDENLLFGMDPSKAVGWVVNVVSSNADPVEV